MAEKTDEEIISEVGLEASSDDTSQEELIEELSIKDDGDLDNLEPIKESSSDKKEKTSDNVIENEDKDDEKELINNADKELKEESLSVQKKQPRIYKILIGIAIFLFLLLATGAILYFTGFFDPEPVKEPEQKIEKKAQPEIIFDEDSINKNKLNKKLTMLTKKEIMNKEELEAEEQRLKEEERKKKEAEEKAIEEQKRKEAERLAKMQEEKRLLKEQEDRLKEEQKALLQMQDDLKMEFEEQKKQFLIDLENQKAQIEEKEKKEIEVIINEEPEKNMEPDMKVEPMEEIPALDTSKTFLSFINVATIKGDLYKSFLDKALTFDKNASLCRDYKNRIEIYFGPYESKKEREKIFNNLVENGFKESYLVDFTQEEYDKRCKY